MSYVYIIKAGEFYKIGKADRVHRRIKEIQTSNPFKVELVEKFDFESEEITLKIEKKIHRLFKARRGNGEWFRFTESELQDVIKTAESFVIKKSAGLVCFKCGKYDCL